jgi:hypothetical protein
MLGPIVDHMAALAERGEVRSRIVAGVVVAMRGRQHHPCAAHVPKHIVGTDGNAHNPGTSVAPGADLIIPPATIPEMEYDPPVRALASFATTASAPKADHRRELRPVDGVEKPGSQALVPAQSLSGRSCRPPLPKDLPSLATSPRAERSYSVGFFRLRLFGALKARSAGQRQHTNGSVSTCKASICD